MWCLSWGLEADYHFWIHFDPSLGQVEDACYEGWEVFLSWSILKLLFSGVHQQTRPTCSVCQLEAWDHVYEIILANSQECHNVRFISYMFTTTIGLQRVIMHIYCGLSTRIRDIYHINAHIHLRSFATHNDVGEDHKVERDPFFPLIRLCLICAIFLWGGIKALDEFAGNPQTFWGSDMTWWFPHRRY